MLDVLFQVCRSKCEKMLIRQFILNLNYNRAKEKVTESGVSGVRCQGSGVRSKVSGSIVGDDRLKTPLPGVVYHCYQHASDFFIFISKILVLFSRNIFKIHTVVKPV